MRVVLDTNVFVSGIHWSGPCEKILRYWFLNKFELVSSLEIIEELVRILSSFKIPLSNEDINWWRDLIVEKSILIIPEEKIDIVKDDADDNKFVECAVEGNVNYVITQDKHLLKLKEFRGIKIVNSREFLEIIS